MKYNFIEALKSGTLHHAFIIEAPSNINKLAFAKDVAKIILSEDGLNLDKRIDEENHPDIYIVRAEKDTVRVEQIRELQKQLLRMPLEATRSIGIIVEGDKLNINGYNRLLKTIEEPSGNGIIIILSDNLMNIPITVRSRCIKVTMEEKKYLLKEDDKFFNKGREFFRLITNRDYFYEKKRFVDDNIKDRQSAQIILDDLEKIYRNILMGESDLDINLSNSEVFKAIESIEEAKAELKYNIKPATVLKKLTLVIGG